MLVIIIIINIRKSLTIIYSTRKGTKAYYDILVENGSRPGCCNKWNMKLSKEINWDASFDKIRKRLEVKFKWFQMRLIHRIIATNTSLKRMKITNDERCNFCKQQAERLEHILWICDVVQHFWLTFEQLLNQKCQNNYGKHETK